MSRKLSSRDLRQEQRQALIKALSRYGYTRADCSYFDDDGYFHQLIHPPEINPYDVIIDYEALVVLHRSCTDCERDDLENHEADFLKAMIPIIGRLDAHTEFDACEGLGWSPRLWIRLG